MEDRKDYYTRTFVDMLTTLELELVQHDDGIGIRDLYNDDWTFNERFDDALDVVDYISEDIDSNIKDQFLEVVRVEHDLGDEWDEHSNGEFSYEAMLSFMDKHDALKDEWSFLIYSPTEMLLNHLGDVDLELAMELTKAHSLEQRVVYGISGDKDNTEHKAEYHDFKRDVVER